MRSREKLKDELSTDITIEGIGDIFTKPEIALPILWGVVITLSLYSMVMTTWLYADWVNKENRITAMEGAMEGLSDHELRLIHLENKVPRIELNITEAPVMEFDSYGRPVQTAPPPPVR